METLHPLFVRLKSSTHTMIESAYLASDHRSKAAFVDYLLRLALRSITKKAK